MAGLSSILLPKKVSTAPIPVWVVFAIAVLSAAIAWMLSARYFRKRVAQLEEQLESLKCQAPQVHVSWAIAEGFWNVMEIKGEQYMSFVGRAGFSTSNTTEAIMLTKAYIHGTKPWGNIMLTRIPPSEIVFEHFHVQVKPVLGQLGEDFVAKFVFVDTKGNEYQAPEHTFPCYKS